MLGNLRCWLSVAAPRFPLWLLSGDHLEIDGQQFVYRGWPKRFRDERATHDYFADVRKRSADVGRVR
jgi:hypothetical protein